MTNRNSAVDAYLADPTPDRKEALPAIRSLMHQVVPDVDETIKYRMPTFERGGAVLCSMASQKHYMSLYMDTALVEAHRTELAGLDVGKSCIRFRTLEALPLDTVRAILQETLYEYQKA
ncbi:MAG: DUF1801 domain-containing protein [Anaerolineae bacterium]|jgi:uncharacterized protein YdhG (YjbR/CyaY superfamily)